MGHNTALSITPSLVKRRKLGTACNTFELETAVLNATALSHKPAARDEIIGR